MLIHIFDTALLSGQQGSLIEQKYVTPLVTAQQVEVIGLYPEAPEQKELLEILRQSFALSDGDYAYEIRLRAMLSEIWCRLLALSKQMWSETGDRGGTDNKVKQMLVYLYEHYAEKISVKEIAAAAYVSERECFRMFRDCLHTTPVEYLRNYRLRKACLLLAESRESITAVSHSCGLGSSSYFGKVFREVMGCTPLEYRNKRRDRDRIRHE